MGQPLPWVLLTHHLPPHPAYFRVKIRRKLERIGAVALKNSVYVLPWSDDGIEDFQWLSEEIRREGGEATVCGARFLDGTTHSRLIEQFRTARETDYADLGASARDLLETANDLGVPAPGASSPHARLQRLSKRLEEVIAMDFFDADGRLVAADALERAMEALLGTSPAAEDRIHPAVDIGQGRTWVTRAGVKVDRIACAWLIRRHIDPTAEFVFAPTQGFVPEAGQLRFDMFEGEFTHMGDSCSFETLLARFRLREPALVALGEIVHDIDCKDEKFGRVEVGGVASAIDGIVRRVANDPERLERGGALLDDLYEHFRLASP